MNTGDNTRILGLYATDCCEYELIMDTDEQFPRCLNCQLSCEWKLVEEVFQLPLAA